MVIKKGTELFHATGEDFDLKKLRVGAYDKVLWTTEYSGISQTYIPVSGISQYLSSNDLTHINFLKSEEKNHTNLIGLTWEDIEYRNNIPTSYIQPKILSEIDSKKNELFRNLIQKEKEFKEFSEKIQQESIMKKINKFSEAKKEMNELYSKYKQAEKEYQNFNSDKLKNDIVNDILQNKYGYIPEGCDTYTNNCRYKVKVKYSDGKDTLLPSSYRKKGRLIILKPKRDLNIYDYSEGKESDLTNLEYHNLSLFKNLESKGYDGVKINDFAQIESEGNFGHKSIGLFNNTIKDLDIEVINNVEHPDEKEIERMFKTKNWQSKEYIEYEK
jgi:hypothetical protein